MRYVLVAGPFDSKDKAEETARYLGLQNHSAFGRAKTDEDGFTVDEYDWFVERDTQAMPDKCFGYSFSDLMNKQYRK